MPWGRERLPTPVFWPGESPKTEVPGGLSQWGEKQSDMAERLSTAYIHTYIHEYILFLFFWRILIKNHEMDETGADYTE